MVYVGLASSLSPLAWPQVRPRATGPRRNKSTALRTFLVFAFRPSIKLKLGARAFWRTRFRWAQESRSLREDGDVPPSQAPRGPLFCRRLQAISRGCSNTNASDSFPSTRIRHIRFQSHPTPILWAAQEHLSWQSIASGLVRSTRSKKPPAPACPREKHRYHKHAAGMASVPVN